MTRGGSLTALACGLTAVLGGAAGCSFSAPAASGYRCDSQTACPSGQICSSVGFCEWSAAGTDGGTSPLDAPLGTDGPPPLLPDGGPYADLLPESGDYGPTTTEFVPSGPLSVGSHQTITGFHFTSDSGPCLYMPSPSTNVVIRNNRIGPCGHDDVADVGVYLSNVTGAEIDHNWFHDVDTAFVLAGDSTDVAFSHNLITDLVGGRSALITGAEGSDVEISCNVSIALGNTGVTNHIELNAVSGTAESPIRIVGNKLRGGGSISWGGGIIVNYNATRYVDIVENVLFEPGASGIGINGGGDIAIERNQILAPVPRSWNQYGMFADNTDDQGTCGPLQFTDNQIHFVNESGVHSPWRDYEYCGDLSQVPTTNDFLAELSDEIWDLPLDVCE